MEENAEQEKADEETDFELSEMEEDDIDLLEPSQNADVDVFVENPDGTDDLDEDEIIAEEMSNEADDTASNQMESHKMKKTLLKNRRTQATLPCNLCSFVSSAMKSHN